MKRLLLATLLWSCSERPPGFSQFSSIPLRGRVVYADGTPATDEMIEFSLLANGANLFPGGVNGCSPGDDHAQALQTISLATNPIGMFSIQVPLDKFVRATDPTCAMSPSAAANFETLDVRAQTDADYTSCIPYCRRHRTDSCYSDCVGFGERKFVWTDAMTSGDIGVESTIRFEELGPPLLGTQPGKPALPDLVVDGNAARNSLELDQQVFSPTDCAVEEACVAAPGLRTLLRFDGDIVNVGSGDLLIGSPVNNPLFDWSACHKHYHLQEIMSFDLLDQFGEPVVGDTGRVVGRKQGFCIEGVTRVAGDKVDPFNCDNQGLTSGWEDVYGASLNCQWLDVTGVAPGDYHLRITVNSARMFPESDFDNDSELIPVTIP